MKWQSLIYTYDGKAGHIYIDGKKVKSGETPVPYYFRNSKPLYFGTTNNEDYPYWLNADLDDIRIYDRVINQEEINMIAGITAEK